MSKKSAIGLVALLEREGHDIREVAEWLERLMLPPLSGSTHTALTGYAPFTPISVRSYTRTKATQESE